MPLFSAADLKVHRMAILDKEIYVARADLFGDVGKHAWDWDEALAREASTATAITILGGYYNRDALLKLCLNVPATPQKLRKACCVRIAVGLEGSSTLAGVWSELREIRDELRSEGFQHVNLGVISRDKAHFHTKLFGFVQDGIPIWYVGSANPGSRRHELMIRIRGAHRALTTYADIVFEKSKVKDTVPSSKVASLEDFFLAGVLCHKPPTQRLFTFDAFRFRPEHRAKLNRLFTEQTTAKVLHARTRTEGFGFGLAGVLGKDAATADDDGPASHVKYAGSAVDTALGSWMPDLYRDELHARLTKSEAARALRFGRIAGILGSKAGRKRAVSAFEEHVMSMTEFLKEHKINVLPIPSHSDQFEKFLDRRLDMLGNEAGRKRHARLVILTPMPNIWDDERARTDFEDSFFADVAYRASPAGGNKGRVIRSLVKAISGGGYPGTADDIRDALTTRLNHTPWTETDWLGQKTAE
jgi:hypothetical protein